MPTLYHTNPAPIHSWFEIVAGLLHGTFRGASSAASAKDDRDITDLSAPIDDLLNKIDHGYLIEGTGERATIPRFARSYLKTSIANGDF